MIQGEAHYLESAESIGMIELQPGSTARSNVHLKTTTPIEVTPPKPDFDRYINEEDITVGKELSHGNFGSVLMGNYKGIDVALKTVNDVQYKREGNLFFEASHFPTICRMYGICQTRNMNYLVMELWKDGNILGVMSKRTFTDQENLSIFYQLSCGLYHLHSQDVIHADIAARNCLIDLRSLKVALTDFGLSCTNPPESTLSSIPVRWASPELMSTKMASFESDVWALGVTFVELLTGGQRPYPENTQNVVYKELTKRNRHICYHPQFREEWDIDFKNLLRQIFVYESDRISILDLRNKLKDLRDSIASE